MTILPAAVIGLLLGHAADLFFDRLYTGAPLGGPVHRCPDCEAPLRPLELLPLVGVTASLGRCRKCGRWLPLRSFFLAPGAAALFVLADLSIDGFGPALLGGFFATVFLVLTFTDLDQRLIPNRIVYPCLLIAMAFSWAWPDTSVLQVFVGGAAAVLITAVMYAAGRGAFGLGDVKMTVLMGLVVGFPAMLVGVFFGAISAAVFVVPLLLLRVLSRRDYIAYGPFIAVGAVIALFWGDPIWDWYFNR